MFEIIYRDDDFIAINKPSGILVHKTAISDDEVFVLQILRDQIGEFLYPVHRLDRGTSGVLIFALNKSSAAEIGYGFRENLHSKSYHAVCRGWSGESWECTEPLRKAKDKEEREATTAYRELRRYNLPYPCGKFESMWISLIEARPKTGIFHQIRRHCNHSNVPIIGDRMHGDNRYNHWFKEQMGNERLLLHCSEMRIILPDQKKEINLKADLPEEYKKILSSLEGYSVSK